MKRVIIQLVNEWRQFIRSDSKLNWTTFTFFDFEIEKESWLCHFTIHFVILGIGIYIGILYKETEELKEIMELAQKEAGKIRTEKH
ncbi:hypothetical protein KBH77_01590 [Patescibacteria group bacterium]|nr:hypothetical protein [Patescibacteria group bacterium]